MPGLDGVNDKLTTLPYQPSRKLLAAGTRDGRLAVEAFLRRFMPKDLRGPPKLLTAPGGFRYRAVPAADYGLSTDEILRTPDADLNRLVSVKRLAPYRDREFQVTADRRKRWRRDQAAREDMFTSRTASYNDNDLIGTDATIAITSPPPWERLETLKKKGRLFSDWV